MWDSEMTGPDLPYEEAMKKKQEQEASAIQSMNVALKLTQNTAKIAGAYFVELRAQGVSEESALKLTEAFAIYIMENART